jgi:hypothetical protein
VPPAFIGFGIQLMFLKMSQYFLDMFPIFDWVIGVDEYIVEVHNDAYIKHISEDVIHKMLKGHGTVHQAEQHDLPFERAISGLECGFPLVALGHSDQMKCVSEVDFGINPSLPWCIQ